MSLSNNVFYNSGLVQIIKNTVNFHFSPLGLISIFSGPNLA